jgi:hypothetical protein
MINGQAGIIHMIVFIIAAGLRKSNIPAISYKKKKGVNLPPKDMMYFWSVGRARGWSLPT